jgi:hypothetical protein
MPVSLRFGDVSSVRKNVNREVRLLVVKLKIDGGGCVSVRC